MQVVSVARPDSIKQNLNTNRLSEGLPMPQKPAYAAERRQDAEAMAASERAKDRMSVASVRRRGVGSPERLGHNEVANQQPVAEQRAYGVEVRERVRSKKRT